MTNNTILAMQAVALLVYLERMTIHELYHAQGDYTKYYKLCAIAAKAELQYMRRLVTLSMQSHS
jgi:hypothetical protein